MNYTALKNLIATHPDWPNVTDAALTTWVNNKVIPVDKEFISSTKVLEKILSYRSEWHSLAADDKALVLNVLQIAAGTGIPTTAGNPIRTLLVNVLGGQTKAALAAEIQGLISRAEDVGIAKVIVETDVAEARTR